MWYKHLPLKHNSMPLRVQNYLLAWAFPHVRQVPDLQQNAAAGAAELIPRCSPRSDSRCHNRHRTPLGRHGMSVARVLDYSVAYKNCTAGEKGYI